MLATIAGEILALFFGLFGFVLIVIFWFVRIIADLRERITRLETKVNGHYWHQREEQNERRAD
jgi:hypothetical protein